MRKTLNLRGDLRCLGIVIFIVLNSACRPQKIIPDQSNTTTVILENEKTPGDEIAFKYSIFLLACGTGV